MHLSHLVRLERVRVLHLLAARLLADLPVHLRDAARRTTAADEANRGVADLGVFFQTCEDTEAKKLIRNKSVEKTTSLSK